MQKKKGHRFQYLGPDGREGKPEFVTVDAIQSIFHEEEEVAGEDGENYIEDAFCFTLKSGTVARTEFRSDVIYGLGGPENSIRFLNRECPQISSLVAEYLLDTEEMVRQASRDRIGVDIRMKEREGRLKMAREKLGKDSGDWLFGVVSARVDSDVHKYPPKDFGQYVADIFPWRQMSLLDHTLIMCLVSGGINSNGWNGRFWDCKLYNKGFPIKDGIKPQLYSNDGYYAEGIGKKGLMLSTGNGEAVVYLSPYEIFLLFGGDHSGSNWWSFTETVGPWLLNAIQNDEACQMIVNVENWDKEITAFKKRLALLAAGIPLPGEEKVTPKKFVHSEI